MNNDNKESSERGLSSVFLSLPGLTILLSVAAFFFGRSQYELPRPPGDVKLGLDLKGPLRTESRSWEDPFPILTSTAGGPDTDEPARRSVASIQWLGRSLTS